MTDIVPELYAAIENSFERRLKRDVRIHAFDLRVKNGVATAEEVSKYAGYVGECASEALIENLTADALPDGKMYWNIANRTVKPLLLRVHSMVNDAAVAVQRLEDQKNGIGLNPIRAEVPEERIEALLNKLVRETGAME